MFEQVLSIDRMENAVSLFGSFDENIRLIESEFSVTVLNRGSDLKISGEAENVAKATTAIERRRRGQAYVLIGRLRLHNI